MIAGFSFKILSYSDETSPAVFLSKQTHSITKLYSYCADYSPSTQPVSTCSGNKPIYNILVLF